MIEIKNLSYTYSFAKEKALNNISLNVKSGEIVLCTGASGCGKSTLVRLINGLCPHYLGGLIEGSVNIAGRSTQELELSQISEYVGTLFQDPERQFFALTVEDEIAFALEWKNLPQNKITAIVNDVIKEFDLEDIRKSLIVNLSEGQKQKVGLAEIIAQNPKILVLDEPTANLDPESTLELAQNLKVLAQKGMSILIVDHRLYWLKHIVDRVLIMQNGEFKEEMTFNDISAHTIQKYGLRQTMVADVRNNVTPIDANNSYLSKLTTSKILNESLSNISQDTTNSTKQDYKLIGKEISFNYKNNRTIFNNFSFGIPNGITCIVGKNGQGKTTLCRLIFGLENLTSGTISINNTVITKKNGFKLSSLVLQNADYQLNMRTVFEEIEVCFKLSQTKYTREDITNLLIKFGLEEFHSRHPQSLSGGQKQRLVIACAIARNPKILILDEPTSGLDGCNMQNIANILTNLAKQGTLVLLITHDLELMQKCGDYTLRLPNLN